MKQLFSSLSFIGSDMASSDRDFVYLVGVSFPLALAGVAALCLLTWALKRGRLSGQPAGRAERFERLADLCDPPELTSPPREEAALRERMAMLASQIAKLEAMEKYTGVPI